MHLNLSQQMKMSQQMKLAPRMIQSMEILQLPVLALQERIEQELEENVTLEQQTVEKDAPVEAQEAPTDGKEIEQKELVVDNDHDNESDFERLLEMSSEWPEDNVTSATKPSSNRIDELGDRASDMMGNIVSRPQSLQDYLLEQFHYFDMDAELRQFGEYLIQNLDENGRLQGTLPEIVQVYGRNITFDLATKTLELIQKLDPLGVGARNLSECLLLQLTDETPHRDVLTTLIGGHLEDISQNRLPLIQRKTGYSIELIKDAIEVLRTLNPYPGHGFKTEIVQNVTPDVKVERQPDGKYVVRLLDEYTPSLRISGKYRRMLENSKGDAETREYVKKKIESAKWLIDAIEQRNGTVKKVAQAIIDHQTEFFEQGPESIAPLKMQQIADIVGVHVTTVSRAVDDKWIDTPRGLYPLKRFFGGGTTTADGNEVAWDKIRLKMREIVDAEDKSDPLSDDALVEQLAKHGYNLARRTVTKYRKAMDIPSSRQRKEF